MKNITVMHASGVDAGKMVVLRNEDNGAHFVQFGCAGHPMSHIVFEGKNAEILARRAERMSVMYPNASERTVWLRAIDPWL